MTTANDMGRDWAQRAGLTLAPLMGLLMVAGVALNVGQTGFLLRAASAEAEDEPREPRHRGSSGCSATEGLINLGKALLKMSDCRGGGVDDDERADGGDLGLGGVWITVDDRTAGLDCLRHRACASAMVLFFITIADYAWQRRKHFKEPADDASKKCGKRCRKRRATRRSRAPSGGSGSS